MTFVNRRATRLIAGSTVGLVGLALAPNVAGAAISTQAFCANVPTGQSGFSDIAQAGVHSRNVECLKGAGVTAGTTPTTYSPTANVTRGQMATFIANMIDRANQLDVAGAPDIPDLPTAGASQDAFTDDEGNVHENNINRLAQANIVNGTSATTFSPDANVSRAQMASFIAQALGFVRGGALPEGADAFTDDETSVHEANINRLATADIVDGTGPNTYNPNGLVSRAQMASFIVQAMADLHADGFITPVPASGAGSLAITPTSPAQVELANDNGANVATDDRTYTVTGLAAGTTYRITLFQSSQISSSGGQATFADSAPDDNVADPGTRSSQIINVNGTGQAPGTLTIGGVAPQNGTITFVVDATTVNGSDTPVIFLEGGATTDLDLDANNRPTEAFGIGGAFIVVPPEGPIGPIAGTVVIANAAGDSFTTATNSYNYDANDTFQFQGVGITQAQFEAVLSAGDVMSGAYNPDPAGQSTFNITTDAVAAPTNVQATVSNADNEAQANDVTVTFTPASGSPAGQTYQLQRATVNPGPDTICGAGGDDLVGAFSNVGTPGTGSPLTEADVPNGCFAYRVQAINPTTNATGNSAPSNAVTVPATPDTDDPDALDTRTTNAAGLQNTFQESGDAFAVCFDEVLADTADGDVEQLQLTDDDGTIVTLNNTNATFARNAAVLTSVEDGVGPAGCAVNQALTVTLTGAPIVTAPGGTAGLTLVGTTDITDAGGIQDTAGNSFSPAGDTDVTVDNA